MTLLKSVYANGAIEIAVPGWPLPAFSTASAARTRAVSVARRSRSVHSSFAIVSLSSGWPRPLRDR